MKMLQLSLLLLLVCATSVSAGLLDVTWNPRPRDPFRSADVRQMNAELESSFNNCESEQFSDSAITNRNIANNSIDSTHLNVDYTLVPVGIIIPFSSDTIPSGWFLCDGDTFDTVVDHELFGVIGYNFDYNDTVARLPDLRRRVAMGYNSTNILGSDTDMIPLNDTRSANVFGDTGGADTVVVTETEMASHDGHFIGPTSYKTTLTGSFFDFLDYFDDAPIGGNVAHENRQPYIVMNYIIYRGHDHE